MFWLTWRQHRAEAQGGLLLLAVLAGMLLVTGLPMHTAYTDQGVAACVAGAGASEDCGLLLDQFTRRYVGLGDLLTLLTVLPALVGVFIGAACSAGSSSTAPGGWPGPKASPVGGGWR
jgi:hypothetical protein